MRCYICNTQLTDHIKVDKDGHLEPCAECRRVIRDTVAYEDEEDDGVPYVYYNREDDEQF